MTSERIKEIQQETAFPDSVRNDTIWNNGIYITNKNIKNIVFK